MAVNSGSAGTTISFQDLQDAYGGEHPISLSEYARGGGEVPNTVGVSAIDGTTFSGTGDDTVGEVCVNVDTNTLVVAASGSGTASDTVGVFDVDVTQVQAGGLIANGNNDVNFNSASTSLGTGGTVYTVTVPDNCPYLQFFSIRGTGDSVLQSASVTNETTGMSHTFASGNLVSATVEYQGPVFTNNDGTDLTGGAPFGINPQAFPGGISAGDVLRHNSNGFFFAVGSCTYRPRTGGVSNQSALFDTVFTNNDDSQTITLNSSSTGGALSYTPGQSRTVIDNSSSTSWSLSYGGVTDYDIQFINNTGGVSNQSALFDTVFTNNDDSQTITLNSSSTGGALSYTPGQSRTVIDNSSSTSWSLSYGGVTDYDIQFINNTGGSFDIDSGSTGGARTLSTGTTEVATAVSSPSWTFESEVIDGSGSDDTCLGGIEVDSTQVTLLAAGSASGSADNSNAAGFNVDVTTTSTNAGVTATLSQLQLVIPAGQVDFTLVFTPFTGQNINILFTTGSFNTTGLSFEHAGFGGPVGPGRAGWFYFPNQNPGGVGASFTIRVTGTISSQYTWQSFASAGNGGITENDGTLTLTNNAITDTSHDISFTNNTGQTVTLTSGSTGGAQTYTNGQTRQVADDVDSSSWSLAYNAITGFDISITNDYDLPIQLDADTTGLSADATLNADGTLQIVDDAASNSWSIVTNGVSSEEDANTNIPSAIGVGNPANIDLFNTPGNFAG